jgi:pimeloyl-ACP methyl ester carboxylesterase
LHLRCLGPDGPDGPDGPTVLFEAGQAGFSLDWLLVQPDVGSFARTCVYDRAGLGWSEAGPHPRAPQRVVAELRALLTAAAVPKPYVLVAHSLGGRYARGYAHRYPDDVLGVVLVDAYHEAFDRGLGPDRLRAFLRARARQYRLLDALARLGAARFLARPLVGLLGTDYRNLPGPERARYVRLATRPGALATAIDEHEQAVAALAEAPPGVGRGDVPLRVLTHGVPWPDSEQERLWQESQRQAAAWSSRGELVVAERSGHAIMLARPDLVRAAIREVLEAASTGA